jgi:hypothetical protein
MLKEPAMPDQRGISRGCGDEKTGVAIQKSQADKISAHKSPDRSENGSSGGPSRLLCKLPLQIKISVIIDLAHVAIDVRIRVMQQISGKGC